MDHLCYILTVFLLATSISCRPSSTTPLMVDYKESVQLQSVSQLVVNQKESNHLQSAPQLIVYQKESNLSTPQPDFDEKESDEKASNRTAKIEEWKARMLLHIKEPVMPINETLTPKLSEEVIELLNQQYDLYDAKQKDGIIIHAGNNNLSCVTSSNCSRFEFSSAQDFNSILSVQIWFHKINIMKNLSFTIYSSVAADADPIIKFKEYHSKSKTKSGWISFELPKILAMESNDGELRCTVEVEGSSVHEEGELSPFLFLSRIIATEERSQRTARSHSTCNDCCIESFYVTVEQLGWESWVVSPRSFNIRDCKGHCSPTHGFYKTQYQTIKNTLHKLNSTAYPIPDCSFWTPKCQPTKYSVQRIMYDYNGTVFYDEIPDMVVDSCGCS